VGRERVETAQGGWEQLRLKPPEILAKYLALKYTKKTSSNMLQIAYRTPKAKNGVLNLFIG